MAKVEANRSDKKEVAKLKTIAAALEKEAPAAKTPADANRMKLLAAMILDNAMLLALKKADL